MNNKYNNDNSVNTYHKFTGKFESLRERVFDYIKTHPGKTRKEIMYEMELELNNAGRVTELVDAGYLNSRYDQNSLADRLSVKEGIFYNNKDFTADKLEERKHLKAGSNKNSELNAKIGQTMFEMCLKEDYTIEDRQRFLNAFKVAVDAFKRTKNYKEFESTVDSIKRAFGGV